jgi:hypothetical protein
MKIKIKIRGVTALLMNKFGDDEALKATNGQTDILQGDRGTPKDQAEKKIYTHEGVIIIPQPNIFRCLIDAGKFFKLGKSKVTTQKSSVLPSCVSFDHECFPLTFDSWDVDIRPCVIPSTSGRILRYRPRFEGWTLTFEVDLDTTQMKEDFFREIVDAAGKKIGLGDFRPDRKGPFGKFVVDVWEAEAIETAA